MFSMIVVHQLCSSDQEWPMVKNDGGGAAVVLFWHFPKNVEGYCWTSHSHPGADADAEC